VASSQSTPFSEISDSRRNVAFLSYAGVLGLDRSNPSAQLELEFTTAAGEKGYANQIVRLADVENLAELPEILRQRGVEGCLVSPVQRPDDLEKQDWSRLAMVRVGGGRYEMEIDTVRQDFGFTIMDAARRCHEAGYRKIGAWFIEHLPMAIDDAVEKGAYEAAAFTWRGQMEFAPIFWEKREGALKGHSNGPFREWFDTHRPEVILIFNSGGYWLCNACGIRVPDDVAIINLRRSPEAHRDPVTLAGYLYEHRRALHIALEYLDSKIRNQDWGIPVVGDLKRRRCNLYVGMHWIDGQSFPLRSTPGSGETAGSQA